MTREELLNKEVITIKDIINVYGVCYRKACDIIRAIKDYNDSLGIRGIVLVQDYKDYWEARRKAQPELNKGGEF